MNFTFVSHRGARPEKTELVKSHVTREAQKRRREAKQRRNRAIQDAAQHTCLASFPAGTNDTVPTFLQRTGVAHFPDNGSATVSQEAQASIRLSDQSPLSADTPSSPMSGRLSPLLPAGYHPNAATAPTTLIYQPTFSCRSFFDGTQDTEKLPQDLFYQLDEMISHYITSLHFDSRTTFDSLAVYWKNYVQVSPKVLLSCALIWWVSRDIARGETGQENHVLKSRVIGMITDAFNDPKTAVAFDNIASVVSICMYENLRGSESAEMHLKGLRQMIDMRGGINNLPSGQGQHLAEMVLLQDIIHSIFSNVSPFMFEITDPILRDERSPGSEHIHSQSPLRIDNPYSVFCPPLELKASFDIFRNAFHSFDMLCIEALDPARAKREAASIEWRRQATWDRLLARERQAEEGMPTTLKDRIDESIRLAAKIHFRATALRIPHDHAMNTDDMMSLWTIIRQMDTTFWKVAHYSYLWIITTGGAAAGRHPVQRSYFVSELLRIGLSVALYDWRVFKQTMNNFLWLQQYIRMNSVPPQAWTLGSTAQVGAQADAPS